MTDWNSRQDPMVQMALARRCKLCGSLPGEYCTNMPISADRLTGRLVHYVR